MKKSLILLALFFSYETLKASHIAGAELTYQCVRSNVYDITYTFYRDCFGIDAPLTLPCLISNSCGSADTSIILIRMNMPVSQIVPSCTQPTTCNGGVKPGIEKWLYKGQVTLSLPCSDWRFAVTMGPRNSSIGTIINPGSTNLYVSALLNNTNFDCDTSPVFRIDPVVFTCINQPYCLDPGIFDSEGDSLVCSLINPFSGPGQQIVYDIGYSINEPLIMNPPISIDQNSGVICFTPMQADLSVYAIKVSEYRNGILIGEVERDIEIYAINCLNGPPDLSGINGSNILTQQSVLIL